MPETMDPEMLKRPPSTAIAGSLLVIGSFLEILAMAHHPSVRAANIQQAIAQIQRLAHLSSLVHGVLIGLLLLISYGFSEFVVLRGPFRPFIRAGALAYFSGVIVMLGAALISGWIIGDLTVSTPHTTDIDRQINTQLYTFCVVVMQACAAFAVVAMSTGMGLWSVDLCRSAGVARWVGILGGVECLLLMSAVFSGMLQMNVSGMSAVIALQAVWNITVGAMLLKSRAIIETPR